MSVFTSKADRDAIDQEMPWADRDLPVTLNATLADVAARHGARPAVSFQLLSGPKDKAETITWSELYAKSCQAANLFRSLGIGPEDTVAYVLPNCTETVYALMGGAIAGKVNPINPLLEPKQIAALLRETGAKAVVTLKAFPKSDVAQKTAEAVKLAPNVKTVLEVDLLRYLTPPKSWIVPLVRPKNPISHQAKVEDFNKALAGQPTTLNFEDPPVDRICALFHTGGTTGMPKIAQHRYSGMVYNGWLGAKLLFAPNDVLLCPLPLFHVFACYPGLMSMVLSGAHVVFPTPAGYRGEGVFDNLWKLIERWQATFLITVPTAMSALMQRPVDADVSSLRRAFSGSAPLPVELYQRFEKATGVSVCEGYGLTEVTCLVSINPVDGEKRVGSVGIPFPHTDVKILREGPEGPIACGTDEVGEICVSNPGVIAGNTYSEPEKNAQLYHLTDYLRTGDLGRIDEDGYLWITGRAKDLIIRGGHNIDPAVIEDALASHDAVAMAGAIGEPNAHSGELPCVYVELVAGADASEAALLEHACQLIPERAAHPKHLEIVETLPKTAVGKIFKPDLRKMAIKRVFDAALASAGHAAEVAEVVEDKRRGLVAKIAKTGHVDEEALRHTLGEFAGPWDWA